MKKQFLFLGIGLFVVAAAAGGYALLRRGQPAPMAVLPKPASEPTEEATPAPADSLPEAEAPAPEQTAEPAPASPPSSSEVPLPPSASPPPPSSETTPPPESEPPPPPPAPTNHRVYIRAGGAYDPQVITIKAGDSVTWVNVDTELHWPSADPHPTHSRYPQFDPLGDLASGEWWTFVFPNSGIYGYHDHAAAFDDQEAIRPTGVVKAVE